MWGGRIAGSREGALMGKKETFEKMTTAQFLLMQLRRRRGKEIEAQFQTVREQARVLALLKMVDAQEVDAMSAVLGIDAEALSALVVDLEAQGLVAVEGAAAPIAEPAADIADEGPADEAAGDADVEAAQPDVEAEPEEAEGEPAPAEEADAPAEEAAEPAPLTVRITEAGRAWVQPPTDLPGLVLADFDDDALASFDAGLDTLVAALEGQCGASAAQLMEEERKRREEAAARPEHGRGGRDDRGRGKFGDRDRGGRGGFDRKGGKFGDRDRKGGDRRDGGRKFDRDDRRDNGRKFDGDRRGGFKGRRDGDDRGYRGKYDGFKGRRDDRD